MTTPHKNQVGQDGTGVNGGEFAKKIQTDAEVTLKTPGAGLTDQWYEHLQQAAVTAARVEEEARRNRLRLETEIIREHIRREAPNGAVAVFEGDYIGGGQGYRLLGVSDADGNIVWDYYGLGNQDSDFTRNTEQMLEYIGSDANAYFDDELSDLTLHLNLTTPGAAVQHTPIDELIGVNTLTEQQTEDLLVRFTQTRGEVLSYANKRSVADLLRQWETRESIHMGLRGELIERFGSEDAAVTAITTSDVWKRFAGDVEQYSYDKLDRVIRDAANSI